MFVIGILAALLSWTALFAFGGYIKRAYQVPPPIYVSISLRNRGRDMRIASPLISTVLEPVNSDRAKRTIEINPLLVHRSWPFSAKKPARSAARCLACFRGFRLDEKWAQQLTEIFSLIPERHARPRQSFTLEMSLRGCALSGCPCVPMAYPQGSS
jgi:hypothetical protein